MNGIKASLYQQEVTKYLNKHFKGSAKEDISAVREIFQTAWRQGWHYRGLGVTEVARKFCAENNLGFEFKMGVSLCDDQPYYNVAFYEYGMNAEYYYGPEDCDDPYLAVKKAMNYATERLAEKRKIHANAATEGEG